MEAIYFDLKRIFATRILPEAKELAPYFFWGMVASIFIFIGFIIFFQVSFNREWEKRKKRFFD